jgi:hypothetical protein
MNRGGEAIYPYPMYLSVCSAPIRSLLDLRGKNISPHKYVVQKKRMVSRVKHAKLVYLFLEGNASSFPQATGLVAAMTEHCPPDFISESLEF